jgi:hypothetical protein
MASQLNHKRVSAEIEATQDQFFADRGQEFLPLLRRIQRAATHADYMGAEAELLERFAGVQDGVTEARKNLEANKAELSRVAPLKPQPREQVLELQERIAVQEQKDIRNDVISHVLRCLADALIWRATGYERAAFAVFGDGVRVGRLSNEEGFTTERARAQKWLDQGVLVFFNDLTNCMRTGDLTIMDRPGVSANLAVEEVKRSGPAPSESRQAKRYDRKLKLLQTGFDPDAGNNEPQALVRVPVPYRHHLDVLPRLMAEARRRDGYAQDQPHPALIVSAVDLKWASEHQDAVGDYAVRAAESIGWTPRDDRHFYSSALLTRLRDRQRSSSYFAPLAIFPLCAEDVIALLMGKIDFVVALRVDALVPAFTANGITVEFATGRGAEKDFLRASRGGATVMLPSHIREQMLRELMTVDTLVVLVDSLLTRIQLSAPARGRQLVFCDEQSSWPSAPIYLAA